MSNSYSRNQKGIWKSRLLLFVICLGLLSWITFVAYFSDSSQYYSQDSTQETAIRISRSDKSNPPNPSTNSAPSNLPAQSDSEFQPVYNCEGVHVIFSTDCSDFQDWQTLTIFYSAKVIGYNGCVTRIASGCDQSKKSKLLSLYKHLYPTYDVHFTPDYKHDTRTGESYNFYNKPFGVRHWLKYASPIVPYDTVIALIDPDMIFLRPLTSKIKNESNLWYSSRLREKDIYDEIIIGKPAAQQYGLGAPWARSIHRHFNRTKICPPNSPCLKFPENIAEVRFSVGPPYIMVKEDFIRLTRTWTDFVPKVYAMYPYLLAEMYAYSMAAAHENLPHLQLDHYMISEADGYGEAWEWVDRLDDVCTPPINGIFATGKPLPVFLHYCQMYRIRGIAFGKRNMPHNIFSCESPMMLELPEDLGRIDYKPTYPKNAEMKRRKIEKRQAFAVCTLYRIMNEALTDYKKRMCNGSAEVNYEKKINLLKK